jgi:hypothetical protein
MKIRIRTLVVVAFILAIAALIIVALRAEVPHRQWDSADGTLSFNIRRSWLASQSGIVGCDEEMRGSVTVVEKSTGRTVLRKRLAKVNMAEEFLGEYRERPVEQDESTVPSKAAPSATPDVR